MNQLILKIVACVAMCLDHVGYHTGYAELRIIGRIAFPIFAFLIALGYKKSSKPTVYALRLLAFGLISEPIFDFCFSGKAFNFSSQNVYFTLLLGLCSIICFDKLKERFSSDILPVILSPLAFGAVAELISCDYGAWGVGLIYLFYLVSVYATEKMQALAFCTVCVIFAMRGYFDALFTLAPPQKWQIQQGFAAVACIFIALYNGKRGFETKNKAYRKIYQYSFYAFYPLHLLVIGLIFK